MEELFWYLERLERIGPWVALLLYYFLRLDRQLLRVIELLHDIRTELRLLCDFLSRDR